jgi:hypothetical protein
MDVGDGIDVEEGEGFARILMPVMPALFGFVKGKRAEAWMAVGIMVAGPLLPVGLAIVKGVHRSRMVHPRDELDVVMVVVGVVILLMLEGMMLAGALAMRRGFSPQRWEIVVERRGVRQRMWGPMDLWRAPSGAIWGIVVTNAPYRRGSRRRMPEAGTAVVKVDAGRHSRSLGGPYSYEAMMRLARVLAEQLERVSMVVVEVRDEVRSAAVEREPEQILARCGVGVERVDNGMRLRIGGIVQKTPEMASPRDLMVPPNLWGFVLGMTAVGGGALLGGKNRVLDVVAGILVVGGLVMLWAWIAMVLTQSITFLVGPTGVERVTEALRFWRRRRRWERGEISNIRVWDRWGNGGRVKIVGMVLNGGRRVSLARGAGAPVEAMAAVLRRELGIGADEG